MVYFSKFHFLSSACWVKFFLVFDISKGLFDLLTTNLQTFCWVVIIKIGTLKRQQDKQSQLKKTKKKLEEERSFSHTSVWFSVRSCFMRMSVRACVMVRLLVVLVDLQQRHNGVIGVWLCGSWEQVLSNASSLLFGSLIARSGEALELSSQ